ncbi:MAG TPA: GFA family protein [Allosphingosinicella sp.]|uniref:GFA family protein n=1 Tax=Allosphingosinicella sp. TaxID=2823234 RepID=UPI002EDA9237
MLEGGCHCGAVRYKVEGEPARAGLCHCRDCQGHTGAPVVGWAIFKQDQVEIEGALSTYESSSEGRRQFCPRCGTSIFYLNDVIFPGLIDVQIATLDDPDAVQPKEQIQLADRIGWMQSAHDLPGFERWPPE